MATIIDVATGARAVVLVGDAGGAVIESCGWINASRLLCGISTQATAERPGRRTEPLTQGASAMQIPPSVYDVSDLSERPASAMSRSPGRPVSPPRVAVSAITVLTAVNSDGSEPKALAQLPGRSTTLPVIDWLPDDPVHVRVQPMSWGPAGTLDVYTGELTLDSSSLVRRWFSDSNGVQRVYLQQADNVQTWFARDKPTAEWTKLYEREIRSGGIGFMPLGFAQNGDELLYLDRHDDHVALFAIDFANERTQRLVYSHPNANVVSVRGIGPSRRPASAILERGFGQYIFDEAAASVRNTLQRSFPTSEIEVVDEDGGGSQYVVLIKEQAGDAGAYYHFDTTARVVSLISPVFPELRGLDLGTTQIVSYTTRDGAASKAMLTTPPKSGRPLAAVVLTPDDSRRIYPGHDALAQFLAAHGYLVLRLNGFAPTQDDSSAAFREQLFPTWESSRGRARRRSYLACRIGLSRSGANLRRGPWPGSCACIHRSCRRSRSFSLRRSRQRKRTAAADV
jgi:hypothetical protein